MLNCEIKIKRLFTTEKTVVSLKRLKRTR